MLAWNKNETTMKRNAASTPQLLPVQALAESRARADAQAASLDRTQTSVQRLEQEWTRGEQQREERQHTSAQVWRAAGLPGLHVHSLECSIPSVSPCNKPQLWIGHVGSSLEEGRVC